MARTTARTYAKVAALMLLMGCAACDGAPTAPSYSPPVVGAQPAASPEVSSSPITQGIRCGQAIAGVPITSTPEGNPIIEGIRCGQLLVKLGVLPRQKDVRQTGQEVNQTGQDVRPGAPTTQRER